MSAAVYYLNYIFLYRVYSAFDCYDIILYKLYKFIKFPNIFYNYYFQMYLTCFQKLFIC